MTLWRPIAAATLLAAGGAAAQDGPPGTKPAGLQKIMLYRSFIQDDPACRLVVAEGRPLFEGPQAASAAASCPDAFAWAQLASAIDDEFWNWGLDQTVWPAEPRPLCTPDAGAPCCDPDAAIDPAGPKPEHCPVFRADYDDPGPLPAKPNGTPTGAVLNHRGEVGGTSIDPGRLLRDLELELVFRNKAMVDYIYRHDLYTREGLGARNRAQNAAIDDGDIGNAHRLSVRFPVDAVMVKADFLHQQIMLDQGLIQREDAQGNPIDPPNDPNFPYLTVRIEGTGAEGDVPGVYYMLAMTNASKALPIWHWYALEHVANRGRCDYIGCNDSFGYAADGAAQAGADFGPHFIPPKIAPADVRAEGDDTLFDTGEVYSPSQTGERITPALEALLDGMGVGTAAEDPDPNTISADDPAWRNYRLKGTQTTFTTASGVPTGMGATITEGGFVNSASCTTCHAQASVDENGAMGMQGVGANWRPNLQGYTQVEMGAPNMSWFYDNGGPSVSATQIDFVWGIFNAACVEPASDAPTAPCASYPDAPTVVD